MARFLISTMPTAGTVHPALAVATALAAAGHQVVWHTWPEWADAVERTGATFVPARHTPSLADLPAAPDPGTSGIRAAISVMRKNLVERMAGQVADYEDIHRSYPVDALLVGLTCLGAQAFSERHGVPWASLGISPLTLPPSPDVPAFGSGKAPPAGPLDRAWNRGYNRLARIAQTGLTRDYRRHRAQLGLRRLRRGESIVDHLISPRLHLLASTPAVEYPRRAWPPQVHFVGPLLPPSGPVPDLPPWWAELARARTVIHITQGTIATHPRTLTRPALRALAGLDALIVVTTPDPGGLRRVARNVRVASLIPHAVLLPRVDLMITNGGFNGTKMALAHGVPLVIAPWGNDQPDVAARVARAGAGINLGVRRPSPEAVSGAVAAVLSDPGYRTAAERVRAEFAEYGNGERAAALLHSLAADARQPPSQGARLPELRSW
jgi:UDP:flavonoid glycosyltransferase YjiC (YdhE family)